MDDLIRGTYRYLLLECAQTCKKFKELDINAQTIIILDIENACYKNCIEEMGIRNADVALSDIKFATQYSYSMSKISQNINQSQNFTDVMEKIINGEYSPEFIAIAKARDLWDLRVRDIKYDLFKRENQKIKQKTSRFYICPKCNNTETITTEVQLRRADEAYSLEIKCVNCKYGWIIK